jgi:hypothetical protein
LTSLTEALTTGQQKGLVDPAAEDLLKQAQDPRAPRLVAYDAAWAGPPDRGDMSGRDLAVTAEKLAAFLRGRQHLPIAAPVAEPQ